MSNTEIGLLVALFISIYANLRLAMGNIKMNSLILDLMHQLEQESGKRGGR